MSLTLIAVEGCTIGHSAGSIVSSGTFAITSTPSTKSKAEGHGVYRGPLLFTFSEGNIVGGVPKSASGSGSISPTALKTKADALPTVLEGDTGTLTGTYTQQGPPIVTGVPFSSAVEVVSAGQIKVLGS